jgi:hypothetical protein
LALAAFAALCALAAPRAIAAPDPYQIFGNARAYWHEQRYPMLLDYAIAVDVTEGGNERVEHYRSEYDAVQGVVSVDPMSDYQLAHPVVPKGIDLGILGFRLNKPLPAVDWLGVPHLAPTYSFGMAPFVPAPTPTPFNSAALVDEIRKEFHDPNPRATPRPSPTPATYGASGGTGRRAGLRIQWGEPVRVRVSACPRLAGPGQCLHAEVAQW